MLEINNDYFINLRALMANVTHTYIVGETEQK